MWWLWMAHTKPSLLHKCSENNEAGIYISHTFLLQGPPLNIGEVNTHHSIQHHCIAAHCEGTCFETFKRTELIIQFATTSQKYQIHKRVYSKTLKSRTNFMRSRLVPYVVLNQEPNCGVDTLNATYITTSLAKSKIIHKQVLYSTITNRFCIYLISHS